MKLRIIFVISKRNIGYVIQKNFFFCWLTISPCYHSRATAEETAAKLIEDPTIIRKANLTVKTPQSDIS